jgi:hypothetical protein
MHSSTSSPHRMTTPVGMFAIDRGGFLTANLQEARRVCASQGGFLFRMGHLYLVGEYEEALSWGWNPERKNGHS